MMKKISRMLLLLACPAINVYADISLSNTQRLEIEQAREAAPLHITEHASYRVWVKGEFKQMIEGSNDFTCLVLTDKKGRFEPSCLNGAAMQSVFPVYQLQTNMLEQGSSIGKVVEAIGIKVSRGQFPAPEPGALVYMMSPNNKFFDHFGNTLMSIKPHIMMYSPKLEDSVLGFNGQLGLPHLYHEYPHLSVIHIETSAARAGNQQRPK